MLLSVQYTENILRINTLLETRYNFWMILSVTTVNLNPSKTKAFINVPSTEHEKTLNFIQTMYLCVYMILKKSNDYFFKTSVIVVVEV
jgi:hypothetical protein